MGVRFRKRIKLAPGIRMNFSGSGVSWTFGPPGASIGIGKRGTYLNTGIPGTGLYSRERIGGPAGTGTGRSSSNSDIAISVQVKDDGTLLFQDSEGFPISDTLIRRAKRQEGEAIRGLIQRKCDAINSQVTALGEIHLYTPDPSLIPKYQAQEYPESAPSKPEPKEPGIIARLFKFMREKYLKENLNNLKMYEEALAKWSVEKRQFDELSQRRKQIIEHGIYEDNELMLDYLEENLQNIVWPRETIISADISDNGAQVYIDIDLPEIEDIPTKTASFPQRGYRLTIKEISPLQVQRLYAQHVHGVGFRIIGEAFASLPKAQEVILSAYSQRPDKTTGQIRDEYLYSVDVLREQWSRINFKNLANIDVIEAFSQFGLRRRMTKTGIFESIEPFLRDGKPLN
jgi:hypothetical protein